MTIDPKDFRTLLIRVGLVTLALRAAPMFTADFSPGEAALALGLGGSGPSAEPLTLAAHAWAAATGAAAGLWRLPELALEVCLPLLAVGYARVTGWGSLCGLMVGLALALGPFAMQAGHRLGSGALTAVLALLALALVRGALQDGDRRRVWASTVPLLLLALVAAPGLTIVPAGLYMAWRAVAEDRLRATAAAAWLGAATVGLLARWLMVGYLVPEIDAAGASWLLPMASEPSGWAQTGAAGAAVQLLALAAPLGPVGALARQLDVLPAPLWNLMLGGALVLAAGYGLATGLVQPDPPRLRPSPRATEDDDGAAQLGAGASDGWRSLGVALPAAHRELGDRDWGPPLVALLAAAAYCGQAAHRGVADGVIDAMAVARVATALVVGVGLAALATPKAAADKPHDPRVRRKAYWLLGTVAVLLFGTGAWHLLIQTSSVERMAARKVARFAKQSGEDPSVVGHGKAAYLAVGARGLAVAALLDPTGQWPQLRCSVAEAGVATAHLIELLYTAPHALIVFGDQAALGATDAASLDQKAVMRTLDRTLQMAGFAEVAESHRLLGATAVVVYARPESPSDPATIRPQLAPGVAP